MSQVYFAGGCFWGVEEYFARVHGVNTTTCGYANGKEGIQNPSYREVRTGETLFAETVKVEYDPEVITLKVLCEQFFKIIDPLSANRQGNDVGTQYRTGIFYTNKNDLPTIKEVVAAVEGKLKQQTAVVIEPLKNFYPAEEEHQKYLRKNPDGYCHVSFDSLKEIRTLQDKQIKDRKYTKPTEAEIRAKLDSEQYEVTQNSYTEKPFTGQYWDYKEKGIYVDIVSGEPLFVSSDKFDSGCGWPSFSRPITPSVIKESLDLSLGRRRIEVRSRYGDSHLGHVFTDGPKELGGLRYCINSAALRFVPYDKMDEEGYGEFKFLVK